MSYEFDFDKTNRILRGRFDGLVNDQELKEFYRQAAWYVAQFDPLAGLTDFSGVTSFQVTPQTVRELAALRPAMPDASRVRVLIAPSDFVFGIARLFELEGAHTRPSLHVVRSMKDALVLLGVQDPTFGRLPAK